jgi:HAD superfamily hydrolase (TIGR01509 family)
MNKKKAVIFDMDGVVSDTQSFHVEIESALLKEFGIDMKPDVITQRYAGVPDEVMFEELFSQNGISLDKVPDVVRKKLNLMNNTTKGRIKAIPHVIDLIHTLKDHDFKLAIASSATKAFIHEVINSLELVDYFDTLVSSYDVEHGKPAPDIFLFAAKQLHVKPEEAIVIEDGRSGMIGATAANMKSIGLVRKVNDDYPATKLVSSLKDVYIDMIHDL